VPTPRVEDYADEWVTEAPRRVLIPVLVTVCVMLLLGVLGVGVWLALNDQAEPTPSSTTASPTAPVTTSSTSPPTTTTSATTTGISVPTDLVGQEYADAAQTVAGLGLEPQRQDVFHATVPAGLVIGTDPTAASIVAPGETIILFVSLGPEPTAPPTSSPTASASDED
jgi:hypothetical protein